MKNNNTKQPKFNKRKWTLLIILSSLVLMGSKSSKSTQASPVHLLPPFANAVNFVSNANHDDNTALFDSTYVNNCLQQKVDNFIRQDINNLMDAYHTIKPHLGKRDYKSTVRSVSRTAPVCLHCNHFAVKMGPNQTLAQNGDTITLVPDIALNACPTFASTMKKLYPEHCLTGRMLSETKYANAYKKGLPKSESKHQEYTRSFESKNFSEESLKPGAILVVNNAGHTITYLGKGFIQNDQFIANPDGKHVVISFNRERLSYLDNNYYRTNSVTAVNIADILMDKYRAEYNHVIDMQPADLITFITDDKNEQQKLAFLPASELRNMAAYKYLNPNTPDDINYLSYKITQLKLLTHNTKYQSAIQFASLIFSQKLYYNNVIRSI